MPEVRRDGGSTRTTKPSSTKGGSSTKGERFSELWEFHDLLFAAFDFYASQGSSKDITHMTTNGFTFPGTHYGSAPGAFVMRQLLDANYHKWKLFNCGGMHNADETWKPARGIACVAERSCRAGCTRCVGGGYPWRRGHGAPGHGLL